MDVDPNYDPSDFLTAGFCSPKKSRDRTDMWTHNKVFILK